MNDMTNDNNIDRRIFFKKTLSKCISLVEEFCGRPQYLLDSLWELDQETMGKIIPKIRKDIKIKVKNNAVEAVFDYKKEPVFLFSITPSASYIFNLFDSTKEIDEIVTKISAQFNKPKDKTFQFARAFFLDLVKKGVCIPANDVGKREWIDDD